MSGIHHLVAFALLLHGLFWGAGLAMLVMPRPWRRFWPVLAAPAGWALQSAVVWAGAHAGATGTDAYAWWSQVLPLALLAFALSRRGLRSAWIDVTRFGVVWATAGGCLVLLALPLALGAAGLTTLSLGSCDAADYAAGARVLQEFARSDRVGFLGLVEVVQVHSVDNFFDYWLRLNHFTPAALIAFNGTVLDCAPHELTGLLTLVLLVGTLPMVFWIARAVMGYNGVAGVVIAGLYGINPINWYAVAHVSPGQLLAAHAIALLSWAGIALWRGRLTWRRGAAFGGVLALGYWLVLGSYNFMLLLCLVPAIAFAGGLAVRRQQGRRFGAWLVIMLAPLALCAALFPGRVAGLAERFLLLRTYDFGWRIPALGPEGWLGMVMGPDLAGWSFWGLRWVLAGVVAGMLAWAIARAVQERRPAVWVVAALTLPVLAGYAFLVWRGARLGTNASYDAYKLFAVFYPLLLPAFCWWVTLRRSRRLAEWLMVATCAMVVIGFNLVACAMFIFSLSRPPWSVDGELRQLRRIEAMADVTSINLLVPDMWSRLWANAFLLRKEQYFPTHTYEGRRDTPLRGEWDLEGGLISVLLPAEARRQITPRFALVDTRSPLHLRATPGAGWHPMEVLPHSAERWQWTTGDATILIENPHAYPLAIQATLDGRALGEREVALLPAGGVPGPGERARVGEERTKVVLPVITVPPGRSSFVLHSPQPAARGGSNDARLLGVCVFGIELDVSAAAGPEER